MNAVRSPIPPFALVAIVVLLAACEGLVPSEPVDEFLAASTGGVPELTTLTEVPAGYPAPKTARPNAPPLSADDASHLERVRDNGDFLKLEREPLGVARRLFSDGSAPPRSLWFTVYRVDTAQSRCTAAMCAWGVARMRDDQTGEDLQWMILYPRE